jgi:rRNA-processing protein FCF1
MEYWRKWKMEEKDIFINRKIYPNASDIFSLISESISQIKSKAIYVLDTNALLLPYTTSSKSIEEIYKVYKQLLDENNLYIPAQVAREFAKNRPEKIKEIFQQLNRKRNKLQKLYSGKYPLLSDSTSYLEVIKMEEDIDKSLKEYSKKINKVIDEIKNWAWDDPVTKTYNSLFDDKIIVEPEINETEIKKDLDFRYNHKIPPGYKDGGKPDDGIGDFLIWLTILDLAKKFEKDVIFVSGEEKSDWFHRSEGQVLYPRFELVMEFREKGVNKSFHIIKLSELLEIFGADEKVVKELELEENSKRNLSFTDVRSIHRLVENSVYNWYFENYSTTFEININEIGFPDIQLKNNNESIGVEILYFRNPKASFHRFNDVFKRAYFAANENNLTKFHFVLVYPNETTLDIIYKNKERIISKFGESNLDFELIVGYVNDNNEFIRNVH